MILLVFCPPGPFSPFSWFRNVCPPPQPPQRFPPAQPASAQPRYTRQPFPRVRFSPLAARCPASLTEFSPCQPAGGSSPAPADASCPATPAPVSSKVFPQPARRFPAPKSSSFAIAPSATDLPAVPLIIFNIGSWTSNPGTRTFRTTPALPDSGRFISQTPQPPHRGILQRFRLFLESWLPDHYPSCPISLSSSRSLNNLSNQDNMHLCLRPPHHGEGLRSPSHQPRDRAPPWLSP